MKSFLNKAKESAGKVSKKVWIIILAAVLVAAAGLAVYFATRPDKNEGYQVLVTGMTAEEASAVMGFLDSEGVTDYRLENNDTILVPAAQEPLLKAKLLMEGYPQTGFSYSTYYDHVGSLSTESERNTAYLLLLQERMGAVVRCFDGVKDAAVTITQGSDRRYVLDSANVVGAEASVIITMQDGAELSNQQADAIRTLVSHAVQGLEVESVAISDPYGNQYGGDTGEVDVSDLSALKLQLEERQNTLIRNEIMQQILIPLYGEGNANAAVHCTVDVNKVTEESTTYHLPDGSEEGAGLLNSEVYNHELTRGDDETVGGVVGAEVNADLPSYMEDTAQANGDERHILVSGQNDYDHDQNVRYVERVAGYITDCTISVTVNSTTAGDVDTEWLRSHVANAAGLSAEQAVGRVSVLAGPFYTEPVPEPEPEPEPEPGFLMSLMERLGLPEWVLYAAIGGLILFVLILILILMLLRKRRKKRQALAEQQQAVDELQALIAAGQGAAAGEPVPAAGGADVMDLNTEKSMELRKDIRKFADENPEIAAQMIRSLLKGGDSDG